MPDAQAERLSSDTQSAPAAQIPAHGLFADPDDRPVVVLSSEPTRRRRKAGRALAVVRKMCLAVVVAMLSLMVLAAIVDESDPPRGTPTQGPSTRG